jgi:acyl carrier protein
MIAAIQRLIDHEAELDLPASQLTPRADLFALGLTSFDAVRLLVAIERAFKIEFPPAMLKCETVRSIESIALALRVAQPVPVGAEKLRPAA